MEILVLPDIDSQKIRSEGQKWAFFRDWPEGSYRFDWISPHVLPWISPIVEGRFLKAFVSQSLLALLRGSRYDLILAHGSRSAVALAFFRRLLGRGAPKLLVFDIESFGRPRAGLKLWLVRRASEAIDGVIYHARSQEAHYREFLPALAGKTHYLALGFGMPPKRLAWDETGEGDFILSFGTSGPGRREWRVLFDALALLEARPPVKLVGADDLEGPVPERVELVPRLPADELRGLMEACAFAVLPLTERGHAHGQLALLDLMSAGAPVIVSDTSGIRDYIMEGTARLYRVGSAESLAREMRWALEHREERRAQGRRGHDYVRAEHDPREFSKSTYEIARGLVRRDADADPR